MGISQLLSFIAHLPNHVLEIFFFILISPCAFATVEVSTEYRWHPENIAGKKYAGKCYEIDMETAGNKYISAVPSSKCRPSDDKLTHLWIPKEGAPGGKCFEVDEATTGDLYAKSASWMKCAPESAQREYVLNEGKCYMVGQFKGSPFIQAVKYHFCKSDQITYKFVLGETGLRGTCFEIDAVNQVTKPAPLNKCKPEGEKSTQFIWEPTKGRCYEVATDGGPMIYVASASKNKCKPEELSYQWVQGDDPQCLEIGQTQQGLPYRNKVADEKCLHGVKRIPLFIKETPIAGTCYEVDLETRGAKVRRVVNAKECRDQVVELDIQVFAYQGRDYCLEIDKNNLEQGYRRSIDKRDCTSKVAKFRWEQDQENPFEGKCLELSSYAGKESWTRAQANKCKTKNTRFYWYRPELYPVRWVKQQKKKQSFPMTLEKVLNSKENLVFFGKCYEIDAKDGPLLYSVPTNIKNCKPKDLALRYFHPREYIKGGCYKVDRQSMGEKYLKKTLDKACKDEFLKTKNQIIEENTDYGP